MSGSARRRLTLDDHLGGSAEPSPPPADVAGVLRALARAAARLAAEVRRAGLTGHLGLAGGHNLTGDAQKKLDLLGDEVVMAALAEPGSVAAVVSEERAEAETVSAGGRFVVCVDPLDGSSNTDINGAVGTIFGVYRRDGAGPVVAERDIFRPGAEQVLAGYVMYGPATILVYTAGRGTHGFTLDEADGAFVLTHPSMTCPPRGPYVSTNLVRSGDWGPGPRRFVESLGEPGGRSWSLRYTGALVADVHRGLIDGGVYFYPADGKNRDGKLRLLYECAPLAFVVEQAGGAASTGQGRILDLRAGALHQRTPLAIGSAEDVGLYERCHRKGSEA